MANTRGQMPVGTIEELDIVLINMECMSTYRDTYLICKVDELAYE